MPIRVKTDHGIVKFPDGTSPDVMTTALRSLKEPSPTLKPIDANEPDTYWGGVKKSLLKDFTGAAGPVPSKQEMQQLPTSKAVSPDTQKAANTPLLRPTGVDSIDGFLSPAGLAMLATGAASGLAESPSARGAVGKGLQAVGDFDFRKPFKSTIGRAADALVESSKTTPQAASPRLVKTPASLESVLRDALEGVRDTTDAPAASTAPPQTEVGGLQKAKVGKRPGGYTTDNPPKPSIAAPAQGVTTPPEAAPSPQPSAEDVVNGPMREWRANGGPDKMYRELLSKLVGRGPVEPPPAEAAAPPASLDSLVQGDVKQKLSAPEVAQRLRDEYGSRDGGRMLYGDSLPGAERQDAIRRLAPGPSRTPNAATERINAADAKGAMDRDTDPKDILGLLVAALGGGTLASHATTPTMGGTP